MIARRQAVNLEQLGPALLDASLSIADDAAGLSITLSSPAAVLRLTIRPDGLPYFFVTWYEGEELCAYEAELRPLHSATGTASSSVASWQLTGTSYAPQGRAADDSN